jgi:hypothetical protein
MQSPLQLCAIFYTLELVSFSVQPKTYGIRILDISNRPFSLCSTYFNPDYSHLAYLSYHNVSVEEASLNNQNINTPATHNLRS